MRPDILILGVVKKEETIYKLIRCLAGAFFIGIASQIKIPLPFTPVPITLQTFAIFFISGLLKELGVISVFFYLTLGFLGFPMFAGGTGGFSAIFSPTAGYLVGFLVAAYLGYLTYKKFYKNFIKILGTWFLINLAVIHGLGILWLGYFLKVYELNKLILLGSLPFILGDFIKIFMAICFLRILNR